MTISIENFREDKGGNPELVRESERRRFRDPKTVDQVIELDQQWIKAQYNTEQKKKEINLIQKDVTERKKASKGKDTCDELLAKKGELEKEEAALKEKSKELQEKRDEVLGHIGNILHDSVPVGQDEDKDNEVIRQWGSMPTFTQKFKTNGFRPHYELVEMLGAVDFEPGIDVAGHRGYFLAGNGVLLNQALINFALAFLMKKGYKPMQPPFFMRKDIMAQAAELKDYDDVLYKVTESAEHPDLDKYMIATAEQPLTAFYRNKVIEETALPIRFAGVSSCFRKEAGSSGRDTRGIFRVHQFEKVEQFCIVDKDVSWEEHEAMIRAAEEFYQALELPYHVVAITSGAINDAAAKKYDLEAWFPGDDDGKGQFRELVSCSNCTCFQSRRMNTKSGYDKRQDYPHMLNSTLIATERAMCCLLENYQTPEGVRVPRVLQPYMGGIEFMAFERPAPIEKVEKKKK